MKQLINIIVACALMAISVYVIMYIPTVIDFNNVVVRLEDNDTIYRFLIYLPIILSVFNSILALINVFTKNIALTIMNLVISIGTFVFIIMDVMGSVGAVVAIGERLGWIQYTNILCSVLLIVEIILHFFNHKSKVLIPNDEINF